ncbi:type VI secretion system tube protein Hcp [Roseomonas sp. HJA6]|uniref:Type VI secretion system tube protein Hcp n=1 Tax=Roseomonas alba TaxID=2846776 RepID=A0ABS7AI17_9PROT|nr:type VI secretion system tube protein Hcp [Neoroseomonas alba]MBW6400955.1 type VI secretion system tube protein Hcp [Neoroseomonas alba]
MSGSDGTTTIYMCFGSVRGESEVPAKVRKAPASGGWMQVMSCNFAGAMHYGQRFAQETEGGGQVSPIVITKQTDASSTGLFREALLGTFDKNVVITFMRSGTDGPQEYLRLELQGCGLVDFQIDGGHDERATERFAIRYGQMSIITGNFDKGGTATGNAIASIVNQSSGQAALPAPTVTRPAQGQTESTGMSGSESTIFMCYGSVRGESEVPAKVRKAPASGGWMKLLTCSFAGSVNYGQRFAQKTDGGGDVTPVTVTKVTDASSTGLFREALLGTFDKNVVITFMRSGPDGPQEYLRLELQGCGLVDFQMDSGGDKRATERFSIRYGQMSVISSGFDKAGIASTLGFATVVNQA